MLSDAYQTTRGKQSLMPGMDITWYPSILPQRSTQLSYLRKESFSTLVAHKGRLLLVTTTIEGMQILLPSSHARRQWWTIHAYMTNLQILSSIGGEPLTTLFYAVYGIILNPDKFQFARKTVDFVGFRISDSSIEPLPKYTDAIRDFPTPRSTTDIRSWFGLVNQLANYA